MKKIAFALMLAGSLFATGAAQAGSGFKDYEPGMVKAALAEGKTVLVDYFATWCSTCRTQARVMGELIGNHPEFAEKLELIKVDWDTYRDADISTRYAIPRRSTLLLLRGEEELGRLVAQTGREEIKSLMEKGVSAEIN